MTAGDSTGFAERYANDARLLDGAAWAPAPHARARTSADPISVDPGEWTVILEPPAFGELAHFLGSHFSAQSYHEGSSFMSERLGERLMGPERHDPRRLRSPALSRRSVRLGSVPKERLAIIENGVAKTVVTDSAWAHKLGRANTGHGLPAPNAEGPYPVNLVIDPGTASLDELIAKNRTRAARYALLVHAHRRPSARRSSPA